VGSLLRPPELLGARADYAQGRISPEQLAKVEDDAIREAVRMQEDIGLESVTDGEFRRGSWHMDFLHQIGGVGRAEGNLKIRFRNEQGEMEFTAPALRIKERLRLDRPIFAEHFNFLKSVARKTPKLTIPSPNMMHYRGGRAAIDHDVYPDLDRFWYDLERVYADEIAQLVRLGCTYLQIDDTSLAYLNDPAQREYITRLGGDGARQHLTYLRVLNHVLATKPPGLTVCAHLCRGNFRSSWVASGGYDYVAEALFGDLQVDGFFLEYDDERSGGFEPLRFVPKGKRVVLGLISTKRAALEKRDDLKRRVGEAARYVSPDQLCISPQCGFSSTFEGNNLTREDQIAKLRLVVETARELWP